MIPKERIEMARGADLPKILTGMGIELVHNGRGYHLREHDSLKLFQHDGIWLYKWWSRNGEVGDGIQYLQRHCGMDFPEAVSILSGTIILQNTSPQDVRRQNPHYLDPKKKPQQWKTRKWQSNSEKLIRVGQSYLLGPNGKKRVSYLVHERGLHLVTIRQHRLGWLPAKGHMPSKLLIPCYDSAGNLIRIRFRIDNPDAGQERYRISKGSNPNSPFPLGLSFYNPVMILESELDAVLIAQESGNHIGVLCMGTTGTKFSPAIIRYLTDNIPVILISLDNDQSGREKTTALIKQFPNALDWPVPKRYGKDPGEAWKHMSLRKWVKTGLEQSGKIKRCESHERRCSVLPII